MKIDLKKLAPHLIAVLIFLIISIAFCKPAFEGKVLQQSDIVHVNGMAKNALDYKEKFGHLPLWNSNLFSGMPNYQVLIEGPHYLLDFSKIFALGLPKPANFFFLACICFYLLCIAFRCNPFVGIFGALAFAYSTYDPVIISAGHDTKMLAIAFAPALLAGVVWLYEKKYWIGIAFTTLFATMEVTANHPQINYYVFIAIGFMTLSYIIRWVKNKEWKHMAIALSLVIVGAVIGIANAGVTFLTTYDYAKYTMRGGKTIENTDKGIIQKKTTGLDNDYAFQYSLEKGETVTLMMPNAYGGSSSQTFDENSNLVKQLVDKSISETNAMQLAASMPKYWGGIVEGTSGPAYLGVISCLLFIVGLVVLKSQHKWWILGAVAFTILMAWGKYFPGFNEFLFKTLPMYSKFRAPSMALVISQILVPLLAVLCLQQILFTAKAEEFLTKNFKKILYSLGGIVVFLGLMYLMNDYNSPIDKEIIESYSNAQAQGGMDIGRMIVSGMMADRKEMFSGDMLRVLGFAILVAALLYFKRRKIISSLVVVLVLIVVSTGDLFILGKKYLGEDNYIESDSYTGTNFTPSPADELILQDKDPHYRVYSLTPDRFNESKESYWHRSIGGYHAAKLRLYQDLIETQLSKNPINMAVLNMLDAKYFLVPDQKTGSLSVSKNDSALGAAWFVQEVKTVNGPVEEINALDKFDPKQTAFISKDQNANIPSTAFDSSAKIKLTNYNNDEAEYASDAKTDQFAVFSEIYYSAGWNAYVDGKKMPYYKVNYLLRGMPVPAGHHVVNFKFEPASYKTGYTLATMGNILLYILLIGGIFMSIRKKELKYSFMKKDNANA